MTCSTYLYKDMKIKPTKLMGDWFSVGQENVSVALFKYEDDANLFLKAIGEVQTNNEIELPAERLKVLE